ncbi:MAG TPA: hypothetical protein VHY91_21390 [Pirellulales bacterium]|nr:hypothetical protein [Pirellulales bacterium]
MNAGNLKNKTMPWINLLSVTLVSLAAAAWGCSKSPDVADADRQVHGTSEQIKANLAKLGDEDRKLAEAQVFCAVNLGNELGCMGVPYKVTIEGRPVFLCCEHCEDTALKDPKATLAALDGLLQKNSASLPGNTK